MKLKLIFMIIVITGLLWISVVQQNFPYQLNWQLVSVLIIGTALLLFFMRFESQKVNSKEIPLIATMAALGAITRVPFAAFISIQPTTFIVMITGYVFGAQTGFMVGAVAAFVSNIFLGHGPWTPWQMFCWGICGSLASTLRKKDNTFNMVGFILLSGACGYLFGWIMNIWHWVGFVYPLTTKTFIATYAASIPFDTLHAIGNIIFTLVFGKSFYYILTRFKKKMVTFYVS